MKPEVKIIHISQIHHERVGASEVPPWLVDEVKVYGLRQPITVTRLDEGLYDGMYRILDRKQHFRAAWVAGLEEIPCIVVEMGDLETVIFPSAQQVPVKPIDYARMLKKILSHDPLLTIDCLAKKLGKSPQWVGKTLSLTRLADGVIDIVNAGDINLTNAYALSRLPEEEQYDWMDRARILDTVPFLRLVNVRRRELRGIIKEQEAAARLKADARALTATGKTSTDYYTAVAKANLASKQIEEWRVLSCPLAEAPKGWDTVDGRRYCSGGMLIEPVADGWKPWHPDLPEICCMVFNDANTAATFLEKHFKEYI